MRSHKRARGCLSFLGVVCICLAVLWLPFKLWRASAVCYFLIHTSEYGPNSGGGDEDPSINAYYQNPWGAGPPDLAKSLAAVVLLWSGVMLRRNSFRRGWRDLGLCVGSFLVLALLCAVILGHYLIASEGAYCYSNVKQVLQAYELGKP